MTDTAYEKFLDLIEQPLEATEKFDRLFSRETPFGKEFTPNA